MPLEGFDLLQPPLNVPNRTQSIHRGVAAFACLQIGPRLCRKQQIENRFLHHSIIDLRKQMIYHSSQVRLTGHYGGRTMLLASTGTMSNGNRLDNMYEVCMQN